MLVTAAHGIHFPFVLCRNAAQGSEDENRDLVRDPPRIPLETRCVRAQWESRVLQGSCFPLH